MKISFCCDGMKELLSINHFKLEQDKQDIV